HAAHERRPRQPRELLGLERLDLAHRVLEPLRDVRDRELALGAQAREQPPGRDVRGNRVAHSYLPFCSCWYSADPAKRRRSCVAYEPSATRSPSLRSMRNASQSDSAVGSTALLKRPTSARASRSSPRRYLSCARPISAGGYVGSRRSARS